MSNPVVLKEFEPIFGDSYYKLRVRLLSRNGRMPVLDVRWYDHRAQEFTIRGVSFPVGSLENLKHFLLSNLDEVPQLIEQFKKENRK
jgi:hypothetical protein